MLWDVKRALEVAAAGAHNFLLVGSPGAGKTLCAKCLPGILPEMTEQEILETTRIHSCALRAGDSDAFKPVLTRPFRSPHHSASMVSLVGGGTRLLPGEASLAHNGVLFLDELPEFNRSVLEALREPIPWTRSASVLACLRLVNATVKKYRDRYWTVLIYR